MLLVLMPVESHTDMATGHAHGYDTECKIERRFVNMNTEFQDFLSTHAYLVRLVIIQRIQRRGFR